MCIAVTEIWISPTEIKDVCIKEVSDRSIGLTIEQQTQNGIYYSVFISTSESDRYLKLWHKTAFI